MLRPALAALVLAATAAFAGGAKAHDDGASHRGFFGAPFFSEFAHRFDNRYDGRHDRRYDYDRGRNVERHFHYRNGKRIVHAHPFQKRHDHGRGWSDAKRFKDKKERHVRHYDHDRRDGWRWRQHRHDHRRDAQRHDRRHDDARDHNHRRDAQRDEDRRREWRQSQREDYRRWRRQNDN